MEIQFEVGKWYKRKSGWYSKFKELIKNQFWGEHIHIKDNWYDECGWLEIESAMELLTDLSEIQQYLPDGHVDKIKEWNPQVGDWVVVTERFTDNDAFKGMVGQITDLDLGTSVQYQVNDSWCLNVRKALPHEIPDNFVLPDKWCIKLITKEINEAVNSIRLWKDAILVWHNTSGYTDYYIGSDGKYSTSLLINGYTEITLEQFKKYVLKENSIVDEIIKNINTTGCIIYDGTNLTSPSSEIHIPKLNIPAKTPVKVVIDSGYPEINIKLNPKKVPVVDKLTIKPINILVK